MPEPDSHLVGEADVETFDRDGVICLRGLFDARWVSRIRAAMDRVIANPSAEGKLLNPDGTPGRFERDLFMWMRDDDFRALVYDSPLGEIAAACMRSQRVTFIVDMMLTKEPNTPWPTPWHHDLPYGWYDGEQVCGLWLSLDHTTEDSGAVIGCADLISGGAGMPRSRSKAVRMKFLTGSNGCPISMPTAAATISPTTKPNPAIASSTTC